MGVKGMISKDEHRVTLLGSGLTIVCWWTSLDRGRPSRDAPHAWQTWHLWLGQRIGP